MSNTWNTHHSNSSNTYGTTAYRRNKRCRDSVVDSVGNRLTQHDDRRLDWNDCNLDLVPIKRLRIESVSPEPDCIFPSSYSHTVEPEVEMYHNYQSQQDYEMTSMTRCDEGLREDGMMDLSQSSSQPDYSNMNSVLGSLHAERIRRMSQDQKLTKVSTNNNANTSNLDQASLVYSSNPIHYTSDMNNYPTMNLKESNLYQKHQDLSLQTDNNHEGKVQQSRRRQTRLRYDSQLY